MGSRLMSSKDCWLGGVNVPLARYARNATRHVVSFTFLISMPIVNIVFFLHLKHIFCMTMFYIPNPTQYLNLTTTLLTIHKQEIRSLLRFIKESIVVNGLLIENWTLK